MAARGGGKTNGVLSGGFTSFRWAQAQMLSKLPHFSARCYAQARPVPLCGVCLSVCSSVTFVYILSKRVTISSNVFSPPGSHTILVSSYQTLWQCSDADPPNEGVECRCGRQKSRFSTNIWLWRRSLRWTVASSAFRRWSMACSNRPSPAINKRRRATHQ